jgi:hypothetical protein
MPKYLVKYSMVAYWETEVEADNIEEASWMHDDFDMSDEPEWGDFSVDSIVDVSTGKEVEIVTYVNDIEQLNRYKGKKE